MPILAILNRVNAGIYFIFQLVARLTVFNCLEIAQLCPKQMPTVSFITAEDFFLNQAINGKTIIFFYFFFSVILIFLQQRKPKTKISKSLILI